MKVQNRWGQCWQALGLVRQQSKRAAGRQYQPYLDPVNDGALNMPPESGPAVADFVEDWRLPGVSAAHFVWSVLQARRS